MRTIFARNVDEAIQKGVYLLNETGMPISPRGMPTLEVPCPVATVYSHPMECVCFHPGRKINPFFHFFEALWILGGREDVDYVAQFNPNMRQFSDNGKVFHAPYGYRLRQHFGFDQLNQAICILKEDPDTRQVVLSIWDPKVDLGMRTKDLPCNDMIMLKVRDNKLYMRVCCRSNDMIWGAYGANAVQFSFIMEYIANGAGYGIGTYTQISDSFHVYTENTQGSKQKENWEKLCEYNGKEILSPYEATGDEQVFHDRLFAPGNKEQFDAELDVFLAITANKLPITKNSLQLPFFSYCAVPMYELWTYWKIYNNGGISSAYEEFTKAHPWPNTIRSNDWIARSLQWVKERENNA